MSMSTCVVGFIPKDSAKWQIMLEVYNACNAAGIELPAKVADFFNGVTDPNVDPGVSIDLEPLPCCKEYNAEMTNGYEIDITRLPKDVKIIRFYNSY